MQDQITVLTPTFNRHKFAIRAANYYRSIGVKAVFADGTLEINNGLRELHNRSKYINYNHSPGSSWSERMQENLEQITTKYVVISADDEFHLRSGLANSLEILNKDDSASCAVGRSAKFTYTINGVKLGNVYNYNRGYMGENPIERCANLMRNYSPFPCYAVWRTALLKQILTTLANTDWSSWRVDEVIHVAGAGLLGNCLVHDGLQWLRSDENPPSQTPSSKQREMHEWYNNKKLIREHIECCRVISNFMTGTFFNDYNKEENTSSKILD